MNQESSTPPRPVGRAPIFFRITIGLLVMWFLAGAALALLSVWEGKNINRAGGWGWLLILAIFVAVTTLVCFACALCTVVSLCRREKHRRLSIAILIISSLVVCAFGPNLMRVVQNLRQQHAESARVSKSSPQPPTGSNPLGTNPPSLDPSSNAAAVRHGENKQVLELKSKLWEAIRAKNAAAFVDCFFIEERFNTPGVRELNLNQVKILLERETIDLDIESIPDKELVQIMKIQNAKPAGSLRYSLLPRLILRVRQHAANGTIGRVFLIGEKNGQWYIVTLAGQAT